MMLNDMNAFIVGPSQLPADLSTLMGALLPPPVGMAVAEPEPEAQISNVEKGEALALAQILARISGITGGHPKVVAGRLCDQRLDVASGRHKPHFLESQAALFAALGAYGRVVWAEGPGYATKGEFLEYVRQNGEQYGWATDLFHSPALPGVWYTHPAPDPRNTGRLDELISMFDVHTLSDRILVKAFACTPYWGGPAGKRPLFVFSTANAENDRNAGRASGKSTLAQTIGKIAGGCFTMRREGDADRILSDLLSPHGMGHRVVLFDNVKTLKFSSEFIESLITADEIGGHVLYTGHGSRPNYLTFAMTMNEPMLSTDIATRSIPILLNQSTKSAAWDDKLHNMLNDSVFLGELYADIAWHLQRPVVEYSDNPSERWPLWWRDVVSRLCDTAGELHAVVAEVQKRRPQYDSDMQSREIIEETIREKLTTLGITDVDRAAVYFPTSVLRIVLVDLFGRNANVSEVGQRVNAMKPPHLYAAKHGPEGMGRGYWWFGPACDQVDVAQKMVESRGDLQLARVDHPTAARNALIKARGQSE